MEIGNSMGTQSSTKQIKIQKKQTRNYPQKTQKVTQSKTQKYKGNKFQKAEKKSR